MEILWNISPMQMSNLSIHNQNLSPLNRYLEVIEEHTSPSTLKKKLIRGTDYLYQEQSSRTWKKLPRVISNTTSKNSKETSSSTEEVTGPSKALSTKCMSPTPRSSRWIRIKPSRLFSSTLKKLGLQPSSHRDF